MTSISLRDFLYKFTAIPRKFINEYYSFYELCQNNQFGIPLDKVVKYLNISSQVRVETRLREDFELNTDYVIIREMKKLTKGVKDACYMLAFKTFEKLCMASRTKKGNEFRDYFVMLREFIEYYKEHISDKIMELTKTNAFIYIIGVNKAKDIFKLGRTINIRKRLQSYATGKDKHPDIDFILIVEDDKQVEKCSKMFAKTYRFKGNKELYKIHIDKLRELIIDCAKIDKKIHNKFTNNNDINKYIVYDTTKTIQYLNLEGDVIGMAKLSKKTNSIANINKFNKTIKINKKKSVRCK